MLLILLLCLMTSLPALARDAQVQTYPVPDNFKPRGLSRLADGSVVFSGVSSDQNNMRPTPFTGETDSEATFPTTYATAFCLSPEGEFRWKMSLGYPGGFTIFDTLGLLPDGRMVLRYMPDSRDKAQYLIVNAEGDVDETLPAKQLRELGIEPSLRKVTSGFLGGGFTVDSQTSDFVGNATITLLDEEMNVLWRQTHPSLEGYKLFQGVQTENGFYLSGEMPGELPGLWTAVVTKLHQDGTLDWVWHGIDGSYALVDSLCVMANGDVLIITNGDPLRASSLDNVTQALPGSLLKVVDGTHTEWVKVTDDESFRLLQAVPYGDSCIVAGADWESGMFRLFYLNAAYRVVGTMDIPGTETEDVGYVYLAVDGTHITAYGYLAPKGSEIFDSASHVYWQTVTAEGFT